MAAADKPSPEEIRRALRFDAVTSNERITSKRVDWAAFRAEYMSSTYTIPALVRKWQARGSTITQRSAQSRSSREKWFGMRRKRLAEEMDAQLEETWAFRMAWWREIQNKTRTTCEELSMRLQELVSRARATGSISDVSSLVRAAAEVYVLAEKVIGADKLAESTEKNDLPVYVPLHIVRDDEAA